MKANILLLSLEMLLFAACQNEKKTTEAFDLLQKTDSMEVRTMFVTNADVALIQTYAPRYNCKVIDATHMMRICVKGTKKDLDALFDYVGKDGRIE